MARKGDSIATFYKRVGARGVRWTARVRIKGREVTRTWATKAAAESWARAQEAAVDRGEYLAPQPGSGPIFADAIADLLAHRKRIKRAPGKTFANALTRLHEACGSTTRALLHATLAGERVDGRQR